MITINAMVEQEMIDDQKDDLLFIEAVLELDSCDAILLVFSDGSAWSLFENISCEIIARKASRDSF